MQLTNNLYFSSHEAKAIFLDEMRLIAQSKTFGSVWISDGLLLQNEIPAEYSEIVVSLLKEYEVVPPLFNETCLQILIYLKVEDRVIVKLLEDLTDSISDYSWLEYLGEALMLAKITLPKELEDIAKAEFSKLPWYKKKFTHGGVYFLNEYFESKN